MENYTNPEQAGQGQHPQDLLNASILFARALGLIFNDNEGIVVDVKGDVVLADDLKKVVVLKSNDQIHVLKCEEDIEEGTAVSFNPKPEEGEQSES